MKKKEDIPEAEKKLWEEYTRDPKDLFDKELERKKSVKRVERYRFDLHGFTLHDANKKVRELIIYCQENNFREILLITGKGIHSNTDKDVYASKDLSKLKYSVPDYIKSNLNLSQYISSISDAKKKDGGEGAIIIKLKNL